MCKGPNSRCKSVNLRIPNEHFREVNTKTTFDKIQFEPTSKVNGIFSDYDLLSTVTFYVHDMYVTYEGIGFVYTFQKLKIFVKFVKGNSKTTQTISYFQFIVYFLAS